MFRNIIETHINEEKITISSFLTKIAQYSTLDQALVELPEEYLEFYFNNEKLLQKSLKKLHLTEASREDPGYLGWAPPEEKIHKNIKYKGNIITLEWDSELKTWFPQVRFRGITESVKYAKKLVNDWEASK